ncbi:MAG: TonB-dependent receptor [bacterium]
MTLAELRSRLSWFLVAPALLLSAPGNLLAGTTGTIAGRVLDQNQHPVVAATIVLVGQRLGAYSDAEGRYRIARVPPGTYELTASRLSYESVRVQAVVVSADQTTDIDLHMKETTLAAAEVVVVAKRPPVDLKQTSTQTTVSSQDIQALPVQELQDVVNLQAGVVDGHFRGGRTGEVQYQVDGVSVNNPFDNKSSLKVDRSLLQEVQVISGTFDAEYGQCMSGVVNAVLKEGSEKLRWGAEAYAGGFVFRGADRRFIDDSIQPTDIQNFQASASGPLPLSKTVFLVSVRRYLYDDYFRGTRRFVPSDSSDFERKIFNPTGDGAVVALSYSRDWGGFAKITNTSLTNTKLGYQVLFDVGHGRGADQSWRLNPDGEARYDNLALEHGLDWTQTLSTGTFLEFNARQNYSKYRVGRYDDVYDPGYDIAGPPLGDSTYELGAFVQGVDFFRFYQRTNGFILKSALTSQVGHEHQVKAGAELFDPEVTFGTPGHLTFTTVNGVQQLVRHVDDPPDFPGVKAYKPIIAAGFVQDHAEWSSIMVRAGVRMDYFDARSVLPTDLANPANAIQGAPPSSLRKTSRKISVSPRLGVAYPIEDYAAVHFAYGHFQQFPPIGDMFQNADYSVLTNLQASSVDYGVLGNPDVKPEETSQYEVGYKHALNENVGLDVTTFYKDIRNLLGVEFIDTYNGAQYARLTNVDFGDVFGFTLSVDRKKWGPVNVALDYTWQEAMGNASDPRETATRAAAGEDPRPRLIPLNWDQRHTFNATVSYKDGNGWGGSAVLRVASGQPYTPVVTSGFGAGLEANSGRKPNGVILDLRTERSLGTWSGSDVTFFARAFNVFDARYFNGAVFSSTGDPYYSRFPETDRVALADPTRFYPPRRIEVGVHLGMEAP